MAIPWQDDHEWAKQFIRYVKTLLGLNCIHIAPVDEDRHHNTDLMFDVNSTRYPVRIRRLVERLAYNRRNEITFRFARRSGVQTEFSKLMHGWGDKFFYGWGDERTGQVPGYTLVDLHAFRGWMADIVADRLFAATGDSGLPLGVTLFDAHDGSATFLAFCLDCMPQHIIEHRNTSLPNDSPISDTHWRRFHDPLSVEESLFTARGTYAGTR